MSLHSVSRTYKKPVFALSRDLEQGLIVSPYEKGTSIPASVSLHPCKVRQSDLLAVQRQAYLPCHIRPVPVQQGEQTHVCTSSKTAASDDMVMKELRYVGLPTSSLHESPLRILSNRWKLLQQAPQGDQRRSTTGSSGMEGCHQDEHQRLISHALQ